MTYRTDWPRTLARTALTALAAVAAACSSPSEPATRAAIGAAGEVKLLVVNTTCTARGCDALRVLGFPATVQPLTPGGLWSLDLGETTARETCLTIPASATFRIIGVTSAGTSDTTIKTWTTELPLALGPLQGAASRIMASPTTEPFVPARARGWRISLPGDATAVPADACGG